MPTDFTWKPDHPSGTWEVDLPGGASIGEVLVYNTPATPATPVYLFPRTGWKYKVVCAGAEPNFHQKTYDDSTWATGDLAIGHVQLPDKYPPGITTDITPPTGCTDPNKYDILLRKTLQHMARIDLQGFVDDNLILFVNEINILTESGSAPSHVWSSTYSGPALDRVNDNNVFAVRARNLGAWSVFDIFATSSFEVGPIEWRTPGAYIFTALATDWHTWTVVGARDFYGYNPPNGTGKGAQIRVKEFLHAGDKRLVIVASSGSMNPISGGAPGGGTGFLGTSTASWPAGGYSMVSDTIIDITDQNVERIATESFNGKIAIGGGGGGKADSMIPPGNGGYPAGSVGGGGAGGGGGTQTAGGAGGAGSQTSGNPGTQGHGGTAGGGFNPGGPGGGGYYGGGGGGGGSPVGSGGGGSSYFNDAKCDLIDYEAVGTNVVQGWVTVDWGTPPPTQQRFDYTGAAVTWTAPAALNNQFRFILGGGDGAPGQSSDGVTPHRGPGRGFIIQADEVFIDAGTVLTISVAGAASGRFGGWPNGGQAGTTGGGFDGGGGGGATVISFQRPGDTAVRWIVAGGGGGHAAYYDPAGGGDAGFFAGDGGWSKDNIQFAPGGATETSPGQGAGGGYPGDTAHDGTAKVGQGGDSPDLISRTGGAGGGGWHGGGGGGEGYGGGGGSSHSDVGIVSQIGVNGNGNGFLIITWRIELP